MRTVLNGESGLQPGHAVHRRSLRGHQVERALEIAEAAGLLIVHDGHSVRLTIAGIRAARRLPVSAEDAQLGVLALPVQPAPSLSSIQLGAGT